MLGEALHPLSPSSYAYVWGSTVNFASLLALSWPSMTARIHLLKLDFLCCFLSSEHDTLASRTFHTLASQDIYSLSVVQQCIFLDSMQAWYKCHYLHPQQYWWSKSTARQNRPSSSKTTDSGSRLLLNISQLNLLSTSAGWLCVWETARDKGPYWTRISITQSFKVLTYPLFRERCCSNCSTTIATKWYFSLWTCGGLPLPLMNPWKIEQTVVWTRLWIWTHTAVIPPYELTLYIKFLIVWSGFVALYELHSQTRGYSHEPGNYIISHSATIDMMIMVLYDAWIKIPVDTVASHKLTHNTIIYYIISRSNGTT